MDYVVCKHDGSTNPVKKTEGLSYCESLASEFMLGTYFVWVHVGSSSLVWAHLGSGSSERIYLPGQGRPESKIVPDGIVFKLFRSFRAFIRSPDPGQGRPESNIAPNGHCSKNFDLEPNQKRLYVQSILI